MQYTVSGNIYCVVATPEELCVTTIAANTVKDCDPNTGEPDSDEG